MRTKGSGFQRISKLIGENVYCLNFKLWECSAGAHCHFDGTKCPKDYFGGGEISCT